MGGETERELPPCRTVRGGFINRFKLLSRKKGFVVYTYPLRGALA